MKQTLLFALLILLTTIGQAQDLDSLLAQPQTIELTISTPQPRMDETFQISIDVNHLRANIFKSLVGKVHLSTDINNTDYSELTMNVKADARGKNEIGPLEFYLNKTKYTTNKINYEVIDPLPNVDRGLWFRKVVTGDATFCIIIEQRIPANVHTTKKSNNSTVISTDPVYTDIAKFKDSYSINGLDGTNSSSNTNYGSVTINGEQRQFMYGYSVYYFSIKDKNAKIKITADKFQNMPANYKFQDIIIQ